MSSTSPGQTAIDLRRSSRIAARRRSMCGGPRSSLPPQPAAVLNAPIRQGEAGGVDLAGAVHGGRRRRLAARKGFFAKLTNRRLKRGVFRSVADLEGAINHFVAETNADPKPFVWTARPNRILAAVKRGKEKLESIH